MCICKGFIYLTITTIIEYIDLFANLDNMYG